MNQISLRGVAAGNLIDIISSCIAAFLAALLVAVLYAINNRQAIDPSVLKESGTYLAVGSILGSLCSILAGYLSARIAKHDEILNGTLSSVLCGGLGTYPI